MNEAGGLVVPWVTRWSEEKIPHNAYRIMNTPTGIRLSDETPYDRVHGVVWHRDGHAPGRGEPLWSEVHVKRQRRAMRQPRCQVCGTDLLAQARTPWLIPMPEWENTTVHDGPTSTPPTCLTCQPVAAGRCPFIRRHDSMRITVGRIEPWGVVGDVYGSRGGMRTAQFVEFTSPHIHWTLAKQFAVILRDIRIV